MQVRGYALVSYALVFYMLFYCMISYNTILYCTVLGVEMEEYIYIRIVVLVAMWALLFLIWDCINRVYVFVQTTMRALSSQRKMTRAVTHLPHFKHLRSYGRKLQRQHRKTK